MLSFLCRSKTGQCFDRLSTSAVWAICPAKKKGAGVASDALIPLPIRRAYAAWGSAAFAWATIAAKAGPSFIAMSASTFRSSSMPASFSPCMNCE